jgi:hypothetical protein
MGVRGGTPKPETPAAVWYTRVDAETREAKLEVLDGIKNLAGVAWNACPQEWHAPFLPKGQGPYFDWPKLTSLFPFHTTGAVFYRSWPIGDGIFGAVPEEVWEFEVSGLKVVQSWLAYRMKKRAGKKSSPLDDIRPERWTPRMTDELLEMLWVVQGDPQARAEIVSSP